MAEGLRSVHEPHAQTSPVMLFASVVQWLEAMARRLVDSCISSSLFVCLLVSAHTSLASVSSSSTTCNDRCEPMCWRHTGQALLCLSAVRMQSVQKACLQGAASGARSVSRHTGHAAAALDWRTLLRVIAQQAEGG